MSNFLEVEEEQEEQKSAAIRQNLLQIKGFFLLRFLRYKKLLQRQFCGRRRSIILANYCVKLPAKKSFSSMRADKLLESWSAAPKQQLLFSFLLLLMMIVWWWRTIMIRFSTGESKILRVRVCVCVCSTNSSTEKSFNLLSWSSLRDALVAPTDNGSSSSSSSRHSKSGFYRLLMSRSNLFFPRSGCHTFH